MPTARTAVLLALGGLALPWVPQPWLFAAGYAATVALLVLLDTMVTPNPRKLAVSRRPPTAVRLGDSGTTVLVVENRSMSTVTALVRDGWVPSAGPAPYTHRVRIGVGQTVELATVLTPTRRGDRPTTTVTVRTRGPFGLAGRQHSRSVPAVLRALPRFASRVHLPEKLSRLRTVESRVAAKGRGHGTEFDSLRDYVPGDDIRSLDWRATARRREVTVRTWRPERSRRVVCVLDTGRTSAVRVGDEPRLDAALEATLLLAAVAAEADDQVDLVAADHRVRATVTGVRGKELLPRLVDAVAPLHPELTETDFDLIAGQLLRRLQRRALIVLFTALEPGALGEGLLPVLPRLAARHKVIVAAVQDPVLAEMDRTPLSGTDSVYELAAAARALADRERISRTLTRYGVIVLDSPADRFPSDVTDAYLELKAAGAL